MRAIFKNIIKPFFNTICRPLDSIPNIYKAKRSLLLYDLVQKLDKYELTQDNYLKDIEPNTFSTVRGETLLEFLRSMYDVLTTHIHNINDPYAKLSYDAHNNMEILYQKLEEDILNKSIRIN